MGNDGLVIRYSRAKAKTILSIPAFRKALKTKGIYQKVKNWSKPGDETTKPAQQSLEEVCACLKIPEKDYLSDEPAVFCEAVAKACGDDPSMTQILSAFDEYQQQFDDYYRDNHICRGYYKSAFSPMRWLCNSKITEMFAKWKGKYHLYHHTPSEEKSGIVTRAILEICGIEKIKIGKQDDRYVCVSVKYSDCLQYKGIIEIGKNQWYFILGAEGGHETAYIVTFDPTGTGEGNASKTLYGQLIGCTEKRPHFPTAMNVLILKVNDDDHTPPGDLREDDPEITAEIRAAINNTLPKYQTVLRAPRPPYM